MKGSLALQEPSLIARWDRMNLYGHWRQLRQGCELFVLHDGPPFANGNIHIGHAFQKVLKDITNRWHFMGGKDISFVPGWDCHGLPIEAQVEKKYKTEKKKKPADDVTAFRQDCRDYAAHWIRKQKNDFRRLGIQADWDNSYETMDYTFESRIVHHFFSLVKKGYVYRGLRPVLWSASEQTALAEAEVEYNDIESPSIYVRFPVVQGVNGVANASIVIWTTTPWSLPSNRAVAYKEDAEYTLFKVDRVQEDALVQCGEVLLVASDLLKKVCHDTAIESYTVLDTVLGHHFSNVTLHHPLYKKGYDGVIPMIPSEFVTTDMGTGFVHTAPCHGVEDFLLGERHGLDVGDPISDRGVFCEHIPVFAGLDMYKAYPTIQQALMDCKTLVAESLYLHGYPHSWRSKKPLFYRATPQWFIALDGPMSLRQKSLQTLSSVRWYPESAENRVRSMLQSRPDWCISRQRAWGVPIALFVHKKTGEYLNDTEIFSKIVNKISKEGVDFWFTDKAYDVLEGMYDPDEWHKCHDIIDVWFESGVTHQVVLKDGILPMQGSIQWPASMYLEGSDQARGWFQSSLVTSVALNGHAPYKAVLTHGFCLDGQGRKMSKSLGNVISPQDVIQKQGADILRLWTAYEDSKKDVRVGNEILNRVGDMYRRIRNTLRYCLGGLDGFSASEQVCVQDMGLLAKWIHHRLYILDQDIHHALKTYDYRDVVHKIYLFCNQDLSAFYFDVCKDILYCDAVTSTRRCHVRTTLLHVFCCLAHWLAPFLAMTTEESWMHFCQDLLGIDPESCVDKIRDHWLVQYMAKQGLWDGAALDTDVWSIHLSRMPSIPKFWQNDQSDVEVSLMRQVRASVTHALEERRSEIRSNLQASMTVYWQKEHYDLAWSSDLLAQVCGVSCVHQVQTTGELKKDDDEDHPFVVSVALADGLKCQRCWRTLVEVKDALCQRCRAVVSAAT